MSTVAEYTMDEVKQHNTTGDLWVVIEKKVYDLTKFRLEHPGGEEPIDESAGTDATKGFIEVGHSTEAREMMKKYFIGNLKSTEVQIPVREIKIAVGAIVIGIATVFIVKKILAARN